MSWLNSTLEKAGGAIEVDVSGLGLLGEDGKEVATIEAKPISAQEYQVLKSNPEIKKLVGQDRTELLGLRMTYEMIAKCDESLSWAAFQRLPLSLIGEIAIRVQAAVGTPTQDGGGVLGEL